MRAGKVDLLTRLKIPAVAATAAERRVLELQWLQSASRFPQSRRLRHPRIAVDSSPNDTASRFPQSRRLRPNTQNVEGGFSEPASRFPQSRRLRLFLSRRRCASLHSASRFPQSRRLRLSFWSSAANNAFRLKIPAVAATAAVTLLASPMKANPASRFPQSRRLRPAQTIAGYVTSVAASRFPQSRRLRRAKCHIRERRQAPPQDSRSRGDCGGKTHAQMLEAKFPPQDSRSRGDCGRVLAPERLGDKPPQDSRSRGDCGTKAFCCHSSSASPPQDSRSRGDCGNDFLPPDLCKYDARLKIPAVAATAAEQKRN